MSSSKESGQPARAPRRRGRPKSNALAPSPLVARLIAHRESQGWTQPETARRLGLSVNTLKGYECGNRIPNGPNTLKILELLGSPSGHHAAENPQTPAQKSCGAQAGRAGPFTGS